VEQPLGSVAQQTMERIALTTARWLPGLIAMLVVVVGGIVLALVARFMIRKALERTGFDRLALEWGLVSSTEWKPGHGPSATLARIAFWLVVMLGFVVGLGALDARATEILAARLLDYVPQIALAVVIFVVGFGVARSVERSVLIRAVNLQIRSARLLSLGAKWLIVVLSTAMALHHLGVGGVVLTLAFGLLFGGIVLALALAVGLGSRDAVSRSWERQLEEREQRPEPKAKEIRHF
jgi:hypothetical protein